MPLVDARRRDGQSIVGQGVFRPQASVRASGRVEKPVGPPTAPHEGARLTESRRTPRRTAGGHSGPA